jgi:YD repeat-containing protein
LDDRARALGKVKPGSALALAGGRPTDVLVDVRTDKAGRATLTVLREGKKTDVTYDARGRFETVRRFVRVPGIADADCGRAR